MRKSNNDETESPFDYLIIRDREETDQKFKIIVYLKRALVFWICFSLFTQPLLAGNVLKRQTSLEDQESSLRTHLIPLQESHEELGDQESSLGLHLLLEETQMDFQEEEMISDSSSQNRSSFSSLSFVFANYEPSSDSDDLTLEKSRIKSLEESRRNMLRWTYLSRLAHRSIYFLFLKHSSSAPELEIIGDSDPSSSETLSSSLTESSEIRDSSEEAFQALVSETDSRSELDPSANNHHSSSSHVWLHGRSFPLEGKDLRRVLAVNAALEATEKVLIEGVHTLFLFLMVSQVFYSIKDNTDFGTVFNLIYKNSDDNSVRDLYQLGNPIPYAQGLWALLSLPFVWGTFKGLKTYYHPEKENLKEDIETLEHLPVSFYQNNIRWFFPCSPYEHAFHELTEALLFEKKVPSHEKVEILEFLNRFSENHGGRSRMFSYYTFYNVIDGVSSRNFSLLSETAQEEILQEKSLALHFLMRAGHQPYKGFFKFIPAFYARYLLWTLGQCEGLAENITFLGLRGFKTAITVLLFKAIIQGILDILDCPQQQGQTWTGPTDWSTLYTYECFQAYMKTFSNPIPGQPLEMLTGLFSQFHLPSEVSFDLSGKTLNGTAISQIVNAFQQAQPSVTIVDLDLSSNNLGDTALEDTMALSRTFQNLPGLKKLNMSANLFGFSSSLGTVVLSNGLHYLKNLYTLDLSRNFIGVTSSNGTISLAQALASLTNLQVLDLSGNGIESTDSSGTIALSKVLKHLIYLQTLNLSINAIGNATSAGTIALAEAFQYLTNLQTLNLLNNDIGFTDSAGTIELVGAISYLSNLQNLNLLNNYIGSTDQGGIDELGTTLSQMNSLKEIFLQQNPFYYNGFCQDYLYPKIVCPLYFTDVTSLEGYLSNLSNLTTSLNLSQTLNSVNMTIMMGMLSQYLPSFPYLETLDLSWNDIGFTDSSGAIALAKGLPYLTSLQTLILSWNYIGSTDSQGITALGKAIAHLSNLRVLDLSQNEIGFTDSHGTVELGSALAYLSNLHVLDLSQNYIGFIDSIGTVELAKSLLNLTGLQRLDLFNNDIGYTSSNGTISLAKALYYLTILQDLNLGFNNIGATGPEGPAVLLPAIIELVQHYSLTNLSLDAMTNFSWSQQANGLKILIDRGIQEACESQLCHGGSVPTSNIHARRSLPSSEQTPHENDFPTKKTSRSLGEREVNKQEPEAFKDALEIQEESFVTSSASSPKPPQFLSFIPYVLHTVPKLISNWWSTPSLSSPSLQEPLEASELSSSSFFSFKKPAQHFKSSFPWEDFKSTCFNASASVLTPFLHNRCETGAPVFNACVSTPLVVSPSLDSVLLLGAFFWKAFISPERQEKILDWTVPFPKYLKNNIDHKLNRVADILQARSSKISPDTLKSYAWYLEDLNNLFAKHYDHATILLSELTSFQDELDYLLLQLTRFERTSERHVLEKQFYDGILGCYKDLKALPHLLSVLQETLPQEDFEKYEKNFKHFVNILFDFEMRGKHKKSNKWMKRFKKNIHRFTSDFKVLLNQERK